MSSIKVTQIPNFTPTTKQLNVGDILINSYDGNAFIKQQQGYNETIVNLKQSGSNINIKLVQNVIFVRYSFGELLWLRVLGCVSVFVICFH